MDIAQQAKAHGRDLAFLHWNLQVRRGSSPDKSRSESLHAIEKYGHDLLEECSLSFAGQVVTAAEATIEERYRIAMAEFQGATEFESACEQTMALLSDG